MLTMAMTTLGWIATLGWNIRNAMQSECERITTDEHTVRTVRGSLPWCAGMVIDVVEGSRARSNTHDSFQLASRPPRSGPCRSS